MSVPDEQNDMSATTNGNDFRKVSLSTKIIGMLATALFVFGIACAYFSYKVYMDFSVDQHIRFGEGTAKLVAAVIDPERVDDFIETGWAANGYADITKRLYAIRESSPDIKYVYVYKIMEDGCHVVFDLDADGEAGATPGEIISFDESFMEYLPTLLQGGTIAPIISDDKYGWLLTVYIPVYNSAGKCVCYAAADVSMDELKEQANDFLKRLTIIFLLLFVAILFGGITLARKNIILPINKMTHSAGVFAFNTEGTMVKSLNEIDSLGINTGDEIENLYRSMVKMTHDSVRHMKDVYKRNKTIKELQRALIITLADMVERRDENTGQHIKKTAAYVKIILQEMKKQGIYADELTPTFVENVITSAPLHDVGKIAVPDAILNKPGKLTDEEFTIMKSHTTAGGKILTSLIESVPDSDYLYEACNLTTYHHEKWNGKGYPTGLSGENIPLSARVMAVADVFDALVSNRSYKKGFPYEKALAIMREETGTHFDPNIMKAFFAAEKEILTVADEFAAEEKHEHEANGDNITATAG